MKSYAATPESLYGVYPMLLGFTVPSVLIFAWTNPEHGWSTVAAKVAVLNVVALSSVSPALEAPKSFDRI